MLKNTLILTEGKADITFLRDYLIFLNSDLQINTNKKKNSNELLLTFKNQKIRIKAIGGYTKLIKEKTEIQRYMDQDYVVLVIQDTDDSTKTHGGVNERIKFLEEVKTQCSVNFEVFLFPNNNSDGDLETLLLEIVNKDKFNPCNNCYLNFIDSEDALELGYAKELGNNKAIVFNYFRAYHGIEKSKEDMRIYKPDYWDFSSNYLEILNDFFKKNNVV